VLYKFTFSAIMLELSALALLFLQSTSAGVIAAYLFLHGAGCVLVSMAIEMVIPTQYRKPRAWLLTYLFCFNFFMPVVGVACATLGIVLGVWLPILAERKKFETTAIPLFTTHRNHEGTGFRGGQVRSQLSNLQAPLDHRLKALVAVQDTPARAIGGLLRELLADPTDDIRLLAYGILDNKEKQITQKILQEKAALQATDNLAERADLHRHIAELYWELIYQNLVQGDMQVFSAKQVRLHVGEALAVNPDDAGVWFLVARLELQMGEVEAADYALHRAQQAGFARERILPYLAEMRFLQRRYADVRVLFTELAGTPGVPALLQLRHFWLGNRGPLEKGCDNQLYSGVPQNVEQRVVA
jgi:polysaccharide biosynthesis protein PelE